MSDSVGRDLTCRHCGARSPAGYVPSKQLCQETGPSPPLQRRHKWIPTEQLEEGSA